MKFEDKPELISACLLQIETQANVIKKMMDEAQQQSNDYGQPKDRYDSFRTKILRQRDMYAKQYQVLVDQTILLQKIAVDTQMDCIQFGSVVKTDKSRMFVSVAIGKMEFRDEMLFVISPSAPIFAAMDGKKVGETFVVNGMQQKIVEVF
ncbi:MAG: hypothetical protein PHR53_06105 [Bacteroidales bacterium]|nr:hypothetical protein [Bacteroidales bacterium]